MQSNSLTALWSKLIYCGPSQKVAAETATDSCVKVKLFVKREKPSHPFILYWYSYEHTRIKSALFETE